MFHFRNFYSLLWIRAELLNLQTKTQQTLHVSNIHTNINNIKNMTSKTKTPPIEGKLLVEKKTKTRNYLHSNIGLL